MLSALFVGLKSFTYKGGKMFFLTIAILGAAGVIFRYVGIQFFNAIFSQSTSLNTGLLFVNVIGSFLIGVAYVFKLKSVGNSSWVMLVVTIGFLGAFTTFSSYALEIMKAILSKQYILAVNSFLLHNLLAIVFCFVGYWIAAKALGKA